jgi:hypothetical protein
VTANVPTAPPQVRCAAPGCATPIVRRHRRGRPPVYCSPACRRRAARLYVDIDCDRDLPGRPAGRVWRVRLCRRGRCVVIADGLGRPSAEDLARQITTLLTPRRATTRAPGRTSPEVGDDR